VQEANPQLYAESPLAGSSVEEERLTSPDRFFNEKAPNLAIIHEKPEHRRMISLKVEGYSNREIARIMEYQEAWVSQVLRQPWARKRICEELDRAGVESVEAILESAVEDSIWKVIDLRDKAESEVVQLACARDILDRYLGKPVQKTENKSVSASVNLTGDITEIDRRLEELKREEERLASSL